MGIEMISRVALTEAERMQEEMHQHIKQVLDANPKLEYNDAVITWLILEIAKLKTHAK